MCIASLSSSHICSCSCSIHPLFKLVDTSPRADIGQRVLPLSPLSPDHSSTPFSLYNRANSSRPCRCVPSHISMHRWLKFANHGASTRKIFSPQRYTWWSVSEVIFITFLATSDPTPSDPLEHSPIEIKRHSSTFTCARTRLWLSMQHEKRRERLHLGQSSQATHQARQVAYGCSPALHLHTLACGTHAHKRDACAAQPRLNATLSRTCSKPHHLAFRMSMHPKHCNVTTHDSPAHAREHH